MKKSIVLLVLLFAFMLSTIYCIVMPAKAAQPTDIQQVISLMHRHDTPGLLQQSSSPDGAQVVFIHANKRYTLYFANNEGTSRSSFLSVWVRPNGTTSQEDMQTFTDHGLEGMVDFGVLGQDGPKFARKVYRSGEEGLDFHPYWQDCYDQAIADALAALQ